MVSKLRTIIMRFQKKVIVMVVSLLCVTGYAQQLTQIFVDREYGYSIRYPDNWQACSYRSGIVLSEINSRDGKSGLQIRRIYLTGDVNNFVDNYIEEFKRNMRVSLINKDRQMIGDISGWILTFQGSRGRGQFVLKSYILPVPSSYYIYIFQAGTPLDMKAKVEPVLDGIADSFRAE